MDSIPQSRTTQDQESATRFWAKVDKSGDCWEWQGIRQRQGYGRVRRDKKLVYAHRLAYELTYGPIPDGLLVCHHCDNPPCCNPAHLFLGTNADNMRDCAEKRRHFTPDGICTNKQGKLTPPQVQAIRDAYEVDPFAAERLAYSFGVTPLTVRDIVQGRTWRHSV